MNKVTINGLVLSTPTMRGADATYEFYFDPTSNSWKDITHKSDVPSLTTAPNAIEVVANTSTTRKGVVRGNIGVRVPVYGKSVDGVRPNAGYVQASFTLSLPNDSGIMSERAEGLNSESQTDLNRVAVCEAVSILFAMLTSSTQSTKTTVTGQTGNLLSDYAYRQSSDNSPYSSPDAPIVRIAEGMNALIDSREAAIGPQS